MPKPIPKPAIMEAIEEMILVTDGSGIILYANPAVCRRSGFEEADVLGHSLERLLALTDAQKEMIFRHPGGKPISNLSASALREDGTSFAVQISISHLPNDTGEGLRIFLATDVTGMRKRLEEQARLITAVEQAAESIIVTDSWGIIQYVNPAFEEITGYTGSEIIGHGTELIDSESHNRSFYQSIRETILAGDIWQGRLVIRAKDGTMCETETTISPVKNTSGEITNHVHVQRDVTHEVRLEQQLRQAQKMEAIGTLAGGIAHDFNNLLMGIQGNVSLSLLEIDSNSAFFQNLKKIEQLVQSGVDLTKQLLGFARGGKYEVSVVDMNKLLKEQNLMFGRTNKEVIFDGQYAPTLWRVEVDRGQIEQVLMNLYLNALQAMPGGGTLLVRTANVTIDQDQYRPYHVRAGQYVKFTIADSGVGMDEQTQQRIFDPFFTTKEMGRGTGLGLASVYGIVKNHEGFINVSSQVNKGTEFEVYLPATEALLPERKQAVETYYQGQGTVLLVDDEIMILDVGRRMLKKMGYTVFTATDGVEALEVYANNQNSIDVIILDMVMPKLNGGDTFDRIRAINPGAKVLLSSGYSINGQAQEILNRGCDGFIQKPFTMQGLSENILRVLESNKE